MNYKFIDFCRKGELDKAKNICSLCDITCKNYAFRESCYNGHINIAQWLYYSNNVDIHSEADYVFRRCCQLGYINLVKWLYSLGNVNIHVVDEDAFKTSCMYNHLNIAQWLYSLGGINIHITHDYIFKHCRQKNIIKWLLSLDKFDNILLDEYLPENLYEYIFELGYLPTKHMKNAYEKYKIKIKEKIKNTDDIVLFEIIDLVNIIVNYV